jgi:hypothetical protein
VQALDVDASELERRKEPLRNFRQHGINEVANELRRLLVPQMNWRSNEGKSRDL